MKRVVPWRLAVVVIAAVLIMPLSGCWNPFAPPGGDPHDVDEGFRERTSPENVIHNLVRAYEEMDAEYYLACLADTFEFWLYPPDVAEDPELPGCGYWGKADEVLIAEGMFCEGSNIDYITLTLTQRNESEIPAADPSDPSSWQYEHDTDLRVYIGENQLWANAGARFLFSVDPNETASNGADLWEIAKWEDVVFRGRSSHDREGGEEISFGRLKARYRN